MDEKANYLTTGPAPAEALALLELRARGCVMAGWGPLSELLVPLAELLTLFDKLAAAETAAAALLARATKAEAKAAGLLQELGEQEADKLALIKQLPPEGDGGRWALQRLSDYFWENGNQGSFEAIEDAAHQAGFCLASDSATEPDQAWCRLCDWGNQPAPPASAPVAPVAGVAAGEVAQEGGSRG